MAFKDVDDYINSQEDWAKGIIAELRMLIKESSPEIEEAVKWAQPVFSLNGPMIFVKAHKKHVNFGFWRGVQLSDPKGLLEGTGEKMRHVKVTQLSDIDHDAYGELVKQAAMLNLEHGSAAMKKGL